MSRIPSKTRRSTSKKTSSTKDQTRTMSKYSAKKRSTRADGRKSSVRVVVEREGGGRIMDISDFKIQSGERHYLVQREGNIDIRWETEESIESLDILSAYQERVLQESGYNIRESDRVGPSRISKVRAVMALKRPEYVQAIGDSDDEDLVGNKKRGAKRRKSSTDGRTSAKKGKSGGGRMSKAALRSAAQAQERVARKVQRESMDVDEIMKNVHSIHRKDCCLACAAGCFKEYLEHDDLNAFEAAFDDTEHIPKPDADKSHGMDIFKYSIAIGKEEFTRLIKQKQEDTKLNSAIRPTIPTKYTSHSVSTGNNYGKGAYRKMSYRQVEVSRGNRQGDTAFYHEYGYAKELVSFHSNLDAQAYRSELCEFMPYLSNPTLRQPNAIQNLKVHIRTGPAEVYYAVESGNRQLASALMDSDFCGKTPFNTVHIETLKFINGEPLSNYRKTQILKSAFDANNLTPLHCAAINPSATYLKELYEALDASERLYFDSFGRTVIFFAAASETSACLEYLLSQGVNIMQTDKYRSTPFIQAVRFGRAHNVELIIKHCKEQLDTDASVIFQNFVKSKTNALHFAAIFGHVETCRVLIRHGCPVDAVENIEKQTPLMFAASYGHVECVRVLIEEGKADIEKTDKFSKNALHLACEYGCLEVVKYLLSQGLDADALDSSRNSPAHYAAAFGHLDILHLLIHYGHANPGLSNIWRTTPCSIANTKGHVGIVKYLLNLPGGLINVNFKNEQGRTMIQSTIAEPILHDQDQELSLKKFELLLSKNADVNSKDINGDTCFHILAKDTTYIKCLPKQFKSFYRNRNKNYKFPPGWNINIRLETDDEDRIKYHIQLAKLLLEYNADIHIKNEDGETPLASAMRSNNHYMVAFLIESGASYWKDVDQDGNSFFHYFPRFIACIDYLQPHREIDTVQKNRLIKIADSIWRTIEADSLHVKGAQLMINTVNNEGFPPIVYGVYNAIRMQKKAVTREKDMVKAFVQHKSTYRYGKTWEEADSHHHVNLKFCFDQWIKYMELVVSKFGCNMNLAVALPKNYKKENPYAKISDYPKNTGHNALHFAAYTQCVDLIVFLLKHGSNPNLKVNVEGVLSNTALLGAYHQKQDRFQEAPDRSLHTLEKLEKQFTLDKPDFTAMLSETVKALLLYGASPYITNSTGCSSIMKATMNMDINNLTEMLKVAPSNDADINVCDESGFSALMTAVDIVSKNINKKEEPNIAVVKLLLLAKADPNAQYGDGDTVLMRVIKTCHVELLKTVLQCTQVDIQHQIKNIRRATALSIACSLNHEGVVDTYVSYLSNVFDKSLIPLDMHEASGDSPLTYAASNGNLDVVQSLLALGANPNSCSNGISPLITAVKSKKVEIVQALLEAGADVSFVNENGDTALHAAVETGKHQIVRLLLNYGANCDATNKFNRTPLHYAVENTKSQTNRSFRVEKLLIQAGANLNAIDKFGRTPLHYAFVQLNFIPLNGHTTITWKKFKQLCEAIKYEERRKKSLLKFSEEYLLDSESYADCWLKAAKEKQLELEDAEKEKERREKNPQDYYFVEEEKESLEEYKTCQFEGLDSNAQFDPIEIVKYFSSHEGVDCNIRDVFGRTPLHYAACVGAFSCTTLLLGKNVDINAIDDDKNAALQLALRNNHVDYAVMLCSSGASAKSNITLKDGQVTTTFGYSLSKSLMNMAYLIMERGVTLLESIKDALINGKFHMVEIFLQSAPKEALMEVLESENQNLWHVISSFSPFDSEIWEEYLKEIIQIIVPLNLKLLPDVHQRTPLHYAAKYGQVSLFNHLLQMENRPLNIFDEDGKSELYYAVESESYTIVKALIDAGARIETQNVQKNESMLLKAVATNQTDIVRLLLDHGAPTDEDSLYGRSNAVMVACQNDNVDILQMLVQANVDLDRPSAIERDALGKKVKVLVRPVFIASCKSDEKIFKILLGAGANPNVYGPDEYPEYGRSLFMYNVGLNNDENQKILLDHNVDLNLPDPISGQSIFYQFLFSQLGVSVDFNGQYKKYSKPICKEPIFEAMIKSSTPLVSYVDKPTGMTPLEAAIRKHNYVIVEKLLQLMADPNVESSQNNTDYDYVFLLNLHKKKIPSILHAILQNDVKMVMLICEHSKISINWLWKDADGRNMLSYVLGGSSGFSSENADMLECLKKAMGDDVFRKALWMTDSQGYSPVKLGFLRTNQTIRESLLNLEPTCANFTETEEENDSVEDPMEIETISVDQIEEDAQIERELLQKEKDAKKKKHGKSKRTAPEVDQYSNLQDVGHVICDESGRYYDVMLLKVELGYWGDAVCTFYKLSIIYNRILDLYILWTRWGGLGEEGQYQRTPFLTEEEAACEFKSIFKSKTSNIWEDRSSFEPKPGKYEILKEPQYPKDTLLTDFNFMSSSVSSGLPAGVLSMMKLVCNYEYLSRVYSETQIDMPLGQVSQKRIDEAFQILKDAKEINKKYHEAKSQYSDPVMVKKSKLYAFQLTQKCLEYSRIMPHTGHPGTRIKSLLDLEQPKAYGASGYDAQVARMMNLSYTGFAVNVVLAAKHRMNEINPLDYAYHALNCSLKEISYSATEYNMVNSYMQSTCQSHELVHLFAVNRQEEQIRYRPYEQDSNRMLLWHGSRIGNFMGILKQGLRGAPLTAKANGAMLGTGVYFADTFGKSLGYCTEYYNSSTSFYRLMLLCEVALGRTQIHSHSATSDPTQYDSVQGVGKQIPNPLNAVFDKHGVRIPFGPCITNDLANVREDAIKLHNNEFMVFDESRVKIRYLLIIKDKSRCFFCSNAFGDNQMKPIKDHKYKKYTFSQFNSYEKELIKAYLSQQGLTVQDIFDKGIEEFVQDRLYKKKWDIPLDCTMDSKICNNCAENVLAMILEKYMTTDDCSIDIPDAIRQRPQCKYGRSCVMQRTITHAKKYQHWLKDQEIEKMTQTENDTEEEVDDETDIEE